MPERSGEAESTIWQILQRICGFALTADFKVQLNAVSACRSHLGNGLSYLDLLTLTNQQPLVMAVGAYKRIIVLNNHQFAVTSKAATCVYNRTFGSSKDRLS